MTKSTPSLQQLRGTFGDRLRLNVSLKRYTVAHVGGEADFMLIAESSTELAEIVTHLWELKAPFILLGSGSNVLVSDAGVRAVVVLNRARKVRFDVHSQIPVVWAESGANLGALARQAGVRGYSGLEWAAGIPGTVGGAVYGNAGAHGSDTCKSLLMATILQLKHIEDAKHPEIVQEDWPAEHFEFAYRESSLKRQPGGAVVLAAQMKLTESSPELVQAKMDEFSGMRHRSQPSGASLGSIFRNPAGDYAGRLIEAAGLKGTTIGKVEISRKHANFFITQDGASASDYAALIHLAQQSVSEKFGVSLELEIEMIGDWTGER